jgi:glutathione synthase/RimK-type ligase-like ATP-grasp enzyme
MSLSPEECCVLNSGAGAWAFERLAAQLSSALGIDVSEQPRRFNYLLHVEDAGPSLSCDVFIPTEAVRMASDKRLLATAFSQNGVPTPSTRLLDSFDDVLSFIRSTPGSEWCLKYPTSCGASGHRMVTETSTEPPNWPRPYIVQEFVRLERPEVYRLFCAAGELFGWVARRFPEGSRVSPWVAHARGARYVRLGESPLNAMEAARQALVATRLLDSFGCVDLLLRSTGEWVVLEVGTDGLFNHVDRELGDPALEFELTQRVAAAFWKAAERHDASIGRRGV